MDFYERFELLDLVQDTGVKTFEAREVATGRPVRVHLFVSPRAPLQAALLKALDKLPPEEASRIIDRGKNEGTPYIVTDRLVDQASFQDWVLNNTRNAISPPGAQPQPSVGPAAQPPAMPPPLAAPSPLREGNGILPVPAQELSDPRDLGIAGAWRIPGAQGGAGQTVETPSNSTHQDETVPLPVPSAEIFTSSPVKEASSVEQTSDWPVYRTQLGESNPDLLATAEIPIALRESLPIEVSKSGDVRPSTERTQPLEKTAPPEPAPVKAEPPIVKAVEEAGGEFTRMFAAAPPALAPELAQDLKRPAVPAPTPMPQVDEGEFTRMFSAAGVPTDAAAPLETLSAPTPGKNPPGDPPPGEFTRMFHAQPRTAAPPSAETKPKPEARKAENARSDTRKSEPGEFTRMFQSSPPPSPPSRSEPPPAPPRGSGEFTRMFMSPNPGAQQSPPPPAPSSAPQTPPHKSDGPGEFTRYFETQSPSGPVPPAPSGQQSFAPPPSNRVGEFTRIFGQGERPSDSQALAESHAMPPVAGDGTATQAFAIPDATPPAAPSGSTEPGEYTRMFSAPAVELTLGQPGPGHQQSHSSHPPVIHNIPAGNFAPSVTPVQASAPSLTPGNVTPPQVTPPSISPSHITPASVSAPSVSAPSVTPPYIAGPQVSMPQTGAPGIAPVPRSPYLPLILIAAGLILIAAIGIILFFALRN